jgi:hypothetical protein
MRARQGRDGWCCGYGCDEDMDVDVDVDVDVDLREHNRADGRGQVNAWIRGRARLT